MVTLSRCCEEAGAAAMRPGGRESMSAAMFSLPVICRISEVIGNIVEVDALAGRPGLGCLVEV
jgi:hypothetical protein